MLNSNSIDESLKFVNFVDGARGWVGKSSMGVSRISIL